MSTRSKGRANELRCKHSLEALGLDVQITPNPSRWSLQNDLFGLFDIISHDPLTGYMRFIQVKTGRPVYGADLNEYLLWRVPGGCTKEVWIYYDRVKEPEIRIIGDL